MGFFVATMTSTVDGSTPTIGGITGGTGVRPRLTKFILSSQAAPDDASLLWTAQRSTAAGTSTSVTPKPLDAADPAAEVAAGENHTVEPTYTSAEEVFQNSVHQRNTWEEIYYPGHEIIIPAVSANGIGWKCAASTGTPAVEMTAYWLE